MINYRYHYLASHFRDKMKLFMLRDYRHDNDVDGDGYLERLDNFCASLGDIQIWNYYNQYRSREFPYKGKPRMKGENLMRDLLIKDSFTHNKYINELYRRGQVDRVDMMLLYHPNTKLVNSVARGIEREIFKGYLQLDDEYVNRKQLSPSISI